MRRKDEHKPSNGNGNGVVKFRYADKDRYMDIEMEGGSDALADGLKSIANALSRNTTSPATRTLPASKAAAAEVELAAQEPMFPDGAEGEPNEDETDLTAAANGNQNGSEAPRKRKVLPMPKILNDLEVKAGDMPLKKFVEEKKPTKALERIVVVAAWLKKYRNLEEFNRDHLYTCYHMIGGGKGDWKCPNDFDNTVRVIASRKQWFQKGGTEGTFSLTIVGVNFVDQMGAATVS
jgi:hypothetical protein